MVPCCTYYAEFTQRKLPDGRAVKKYEELLEYLVAKDPQAIKIKELDFEGKNKVVYWTKEARNSERTIEK